MLKQPNHELFVLENDFIRVGIIPKIGGKITSFYKKDKNFELIFQNGCERETEFKLYDDFGKSAWGFDDAFPCIKSETVVYDGKPVMYPDHGEIWTLPFSAYRDGDCLVLKAESRFMPYTYCKALSLNKNSLNISYQIENSSDEPIPFIWTMHCLINCESNMELIFPKNTTEVETVKIKSDYLGKKGTLHTFPVTTDVFGNEYRLDRIFDKTANKTEKYYIREKTTDGVCGAYYPNNNVTFKTYFDPEKLPYLGFYITEGGYNGGYNCAMEPSTGYYDSIRTAKNSKSLLYLEKNKPFVFDLKLELV